MAQSKVLKEMREDCECERTKYCPLEILLMSMGDRLLEQHKCVEIYRWNRGKEGATLSWDDAYQEWCSRGYAKLFADYYNEDRTAKQVYKLIENDRQKKDRES